MALPLALGMMALGGIKGLFGNKAAKNEAANQKAMLDWKLINEMQKPLDRRRALLSGLMSQLSKADPDKKTYGSFWSPEMFGDLGGTLTSRDWTYDLAPKLKAQSGLSAFLGGALGGLGDFVGNGAAADIAARGRIGFPGSVSVMSPGQPTGASAIAGAGGIRRTGGMVNLLDEQQ